MAEEKCPKIYLRKDWDARVKLTPPNLHPNPNNLHQFVGRKDIIEHLKNDIIRKRGWTYLISGVRGSGKTSTVVQAINKAWKELDTLNNADPVILFPLIIGASEISGLVKGDKKTGIGVSFNPKTMLYAVIRAVEEGLRHDGHIFRDYMPCNIPHVPGKITEKLKHLKERRNREQNKEKRKELKAEIKIEKKRQKLQDKIAKKLEKLEEKISKEQTEGEKNELNTKLKRFKEELLGQTLQELHEELKPIFKLASQKALASEYSEQLSDALAREYGGGIKVSIPDTPLEISANASEKKTTELQTSLRYDNTLGSVQHDLMNILRKLDVNGFKLVVVFDELDKVEPNINLDDIIRTFKGFFGESEALFFFITDKEYYEHIEDKINKAKKGGVYAVEHTFFSHRHFLPKPDLDDMKEYLANVFINNERNRWDYKEGSVDNSTGAFTGDTFTDPAVEEIANALIFKARAHFFDLKNVIIDHLKYAENQPYIAIDKKTSYKDYKVYGSCQKAVSDIYNSYKSGNPSGQYFNDELILHMYRPFDRKDYGDEFTAAEFGYLNKRLWGSCLLSQDSVDAADAAFRDLLNRLKNEGLAETQDNKIYKLIHPSRVVVPPKEAIEMEAEITEEFPPEEEIKVYPRVVLVAESVAATCTEKLPLDKEVEAYFKEAPKGAKRPARRDLLEFEESFLKRWEHNIPGFVEVLQSEESPDNIDKYPALKNACEIIKDLQGDRKDEYNRESLQVLQSDLLKDVVRVQGGLAEHPTANAVEPLIASLKDEAANVRYWAAKALGEIKDPKAVEPLIASLKDGDAGVRFGAAGALGKIKDTRAVESLITSLKDENADVRFGAAKALGKIKDTRAVESLITSRKDENASVRHVAVWALVKIKDTRAVESLITSLKDEDASVRHVAVWALGEIKDPKAVEPLKACLEREKDTGVCNAIKEALAKLKVRPLQEFEERFLNRFKDIVPGLIEVLQDVRFPKMKTQLSELEEAQKILDDLQKERKGEYTVQQLENVSANILQAALKTAINLKEYPVPVAVKSLIECLKDEDPELRKKVAWALRESQDKSAVEPMLESLRDKNAEVRRPAALFLGKVGEKRAVEPLIELLTDDESSVRWAATWALGKLQDNKAVKPLINESLRDEVAEIRTQAAQSLAELRDKQAVEPLKSRLEVEKHEEVRNAIQDALEKLEA